LDQYDYDNSDGLVLPPNPPTSEQVFTTAHTEFGHCANEKYRHLSQHPAGAPVKPVEEQEPPYYILLSTYISYLILICIGHVRDFVGKRLNPSSYKHLMPHDVSCVSARFFWGSNLTPVAQGYAPLNSDFDSFYTRRLKTRLDDCFSNPITGVAGRTVLVLDRHSDDFNRSHTLTGTRTRALNISSYNYLGFAQSIGGCADAVEESLKRYGVSSCGSRLHGGTNDLHVLGEALVARFVGMEDALISSMGFATNSTFIPALVGKGCLVISDELNHASIRFGVRLSGANIRMFKHNDTNSLEALLKEVISQGQPKTHRPWKKILLIVEGLYSMEGTLANIPKILELKKKYKV
jgi:serine palmitoyltransferase